MQVRNDAYREILHRGLLAIRDMAAHQGNAQIAELEADHLHNLPSLIDEPNETRHCYYLFQERVYYLDRLKNQASKDYLDFVLPRYNETWKVLETITEKKASKST